MADEDRYSDGNWLVDGLLLGGMFLKFNRDDFCDNELEEFQAEQDASPNAPVSMEHEFLNMPSNGDEPGWARLHMEILKPRTLHVADFIARRFAEGTCPARIRIRSISPDDMQQLLAHKKVGNEAFSRKDYEQAIQHYNDALTAIRVDLFVAPSEHIKEVVNVLSNQAECYIRLKRYQNAGSTATCALMFDNGHEKSRMRRAKAELAIAGDSYLIQAQVDLQEVVENNSSKAGVKEATEYLEQLDELLTMEKATFQDRNPDGDWDSYVRMVKSKCW